MSKATIKRRLRLSLSKRARGWVKPIVLEIKPIPSALVERLRKSAPAIEKLLGRMANVDHRRNDPQAGAHPARRTIPKTDTVEWGRRVRQMSVKRNFEGVELVIKKSHYSGTALQELELVRSRVWQYKKNADRGDPILLGPVAEAISDKLIAMPKIDAPTAYEILGKEGHRGQEFFKRITEKFGVSELDLRRASQRILLETELESKNIWLLGFKRGRFVFMAMPDFG